MAATTSLRVPGIVLGAVGSLLFTLGVVIDYVRPVPQCPPPRGNLCAEAGYETLRIVVPGMWIVALALTVAGMVLLFLHWRRESKEEAQPRAQPSE